MRQEGYTQLIGNTGYLLLKIPQEILDEIKISVDEIQNNFTQAIPANNKLAGQIDKEYNIKLTDKTSQYIKWTVDQYHKHNPQYLDNYRKLFPNGEFSLVEGANTWINFQEKYEYNPMHDHSGVFSYVMWYQIPFYKEDEIKYGAGNNKNKELPNANGEFHFIYHDGEKMNYWEVGIDKNSEGYMAVFPSNLAHLVYPFYTSDDYRITISGNIFLQGQQPTA